MRAILFVLMFCLVSVPAAAADKARIAVASNFTSTMQQLARQFEQMTGYELVVSYGSTGKLFSQVTKGAPFEVFLAADSARPRRLEGLGLIANNSRFTYAKGEIALWSPMAKSKDELVEMLKAGDFKYIALANPKTAPYGKAATEVLNKMGLDKRFKRRTVKGENIAQTYQFVYSGNAALGFVAHSQLIAAGEKLSGSFWQVPAEMYSPIEQQAVLLKRGEQSPAARAFVDFMRSEQAQKIISANGYGAEPSSTTEAVNVSYRY